MDAETLTDREIEDHVLAFAYMLTGGVYAEHGAAIEELVDRFHVMRMACDALKAGLDEVVGELNMLDAEVPT